MVVTVTAHSIVWYSQLFIFKREVGPLAFIATGNALSAPLILMLNVVNWSELQNAGNKILRLFTLDNDFVSKLYSCS